MKSKTVNGFVTSGNRDLAAGFRRLTRPAEAERPQTPVEKPRRYLGSEPRAGFTLIDVVIAIALLGVASTILGLIFPGIKLSQLSRSHIIASSIAQRKMDELRSTPFDSLALETNISFADSDLGKLKDSAAVYTVAEFDADGDSVPDSDIKKITVRVTWIEAGGTKEQVLTTLTAAMGLSP